MKTKKKATLDYQIPKISIMQVDSSFELLQESGETTSSPRTFEFLDT